MVRSCVGQSVFCRPAVLSLDLQTSVRWRSSARSGSSNRWLDRQHRDPHVKQAIIEGYRSRSAYKLVSIQEKFRLLKPGRQIIDLGCAPGGWMQVAARYMRLTPAQPPRPAVTPSKPGPTGKSLAAAPAPVVLAPPVQSETHLSVFSLLADPSEDEVDTDAATDRPGATRRSVLVGVDLLPVAPVPGGVIIEGDFTTPTVQSQVLAAMKHNLADVVLSDMAHSFVGDDGTDHLKQMALANTALEFALRVLRPGGDFVVKVRQGRTDGKYAAHLRTLFERVTISKPPASRQESAEYYLVCQKRLPPAIAAVSTTS